MLYIDAQIAQVCHEANRALQQIHVTGGDRSIAVAPPWWQLDEPTRLRNIAGVAAARRGATPEQLHQEWCDALGAEGWQFGKVKNAETRRHPCLVSYDQLPGKQRHKDEVFAAIVAALAPAAVMDNERAEQIREQFCGPRETAVIEQRQARVGDIVHYVAHGTPIQADGSQVFQSECRAAVVTQVGLIRDRVGLCVLNPSGQFFQEWIDHDPGTYSGPERTVTAGEEMPLIGCHDLTFDGGSWHRLPA